MLISDITWSSWTLSEASGRGALMVNSCSYTGGPTCVESHSSHYPAEISLERQASGSGITVFSAMNLRFIDAGPASLSRGTYILDRPKRF